MLASTLVPQLLSPSHAPLDQDINMSFGSMLLRGLTVSENDGDLETCSRAASVLSHMLRDNARCKEKVYSLSHTHKNTYEALKIELEAPRQSLGAPEPLMHHMMKCLALASARNNTDGNSDGKEASYVQQIILKLLVIWLVDCPAAVQCFLDARPHLAYLLELLSNESATMCIRGLAAVLLGECVLYNNTVESGKDAFAVVDAISQRVGLTSYFLKFDEMQKSPLLTSVEQSELHKPLTRSSAGSMADIEDANDNNAFNQKNEDHPILVSLFDAGFLTLLKSLEANIRERTVQVYSYPKGRVAVVPAELGYRSGESDGDYIQRLKAFVEKQCSEIQDLLSRNANLAEDLAKTGQGSEQRTTGSLDRVQVETLRAQLKEVSQRLDTIKSEKSKIESEAARYKDLAARMESDLKSLSDAYNSLEQANFQLEKEVRALRSGGGVTYSDIEAIKAEAGEEAQKESEGELSDLLVCLGQEQSKVERLSTRLMELGEDVDKLLEGIGDDTELPEDYEDED